MPSIPNVREQHSATQRSPVPARLFDRILGFDFFISYSHADAQSYAERLNQALLGAGFKAFLDNEVYVAGDDLNTETLRRVRSSSKLIVVVGPGALRSPWVLAEVQAAVDADKPIIAIDLLGDLSERHGESELAALLERTSGSRVTLEPRMTNPTPPRQIVTRVLTNLKHAYVLAEDLVGAVTALDRLLLVDPSRFEEQRDRGLLYGQLGLGQAATQDLEAYLAAVPDAPDRDRIQGLLPHLQVLRGELN